MTRKEAIEILKRNKPTSDPIRCGTELCEAVDMAIEALQKPERKHSQWIDGEAKCPVCGEDKFKDLDADIWADWKPQFCPNCGADMRGEQE